MLLPSIPLGAGAANEIGAKYSLPGRATVRPSTLRAIFMDLADQLGSQGFRWIFLVHGHGDPAHSCMLDEAGDYFHDTCGDALVNVFGQRCPRRISARPSSAPRTGSRSMRR